jgi:hypothetical protein
MQHQTAIISVEKIMSRIENKSAQLAQIEALLLAYPQGLTQAGLARQPGVQRSAISRNLLDISVLFFSETGRLVDDHTPSNGWNVLSRPAGPGVSGTPTRSSWCPLRMVD